MDGLDKVLSAPLAGTWAAEPRKAGSTPSRAAWGRTPDAIESQRRQQELL